MRLDEHFSLRVLRHGRCLPCRRPRDNHARQACDSFPGSIAGCRNSFVKNGGRANREPHRWQWRSLRYCLGKRGRHPASDHQERYLGCAGGHIQGWPIAQGEYPHRRGDRFDGRSSQLWKRVSSAAVRGRAPHWCFVRGPRGIRPAACGCHRHFRQWRQDRYSRIGRQERSSHYHQGGGEHRAWTCGTNRNN